MAKVLNGVVLSDRLFAEYQKYKRGDRFDKQLVSRMFRFFMSEAPVTNIAQYERTGFALEIGTKKALANNGLKQQSLVDLAQDNSLYKVILCDDSSDFPYINVTDPSEKFEVNMSISYEDAEPRIKAIEHLKSLCAKAKRITVYDKFFTASYQDNVSLLSQVLPRHPLVIVIACDVTDSEMADIQGIHGEWVVQKSSHRAFHDRYLLIDSSLEIVLSSGFDHLSRPRGDLLYLVRSIASPRL